MPSTGECCHEDKNQLLLIWLLNYLDPAYIYVKLIYIMCVCKQGRRHKTRYSPFLSGTFSFEEKGGFTSFIDIT